MSPRLFFKQEINYVTKNDCVKKVLKKIFLMLTRIEYVWWMKKSLVCKSNFVKGYFLVKIGILSLIELFFIFQLWSHFRYKHFKNNEKRGATLVTHSDICTFTFFRDSSVMRLVDNDLDFETMTPRKIRRFNKNRQGDERWKGIARVNTFFYLSSKK